MGYRSEFGLIELAKVAITFNLIKKAFGLKVGTDNIVMPSYRTVLKHSP